MSFLLLGNEYVHDQLSARKVLISADKAVAKEVAWLIKRPIYGLLEVSDVSDEVSFSFSTVFTV